MGKKDEKIKALEHENKYLLQEITDLTEMLTISMDNIDMSYGEGLQELADKWYAYIKKR